MSVLQPPVYPVQTAQKFEVTNAPEHTTQKRWDQTDDFDFGAPGRKVFTAELGPEIPDDCTEGFPLHEFIKCPFHPYGKGDQQHSEGGLSGRYQDQMGLLENLVVNHMYKKLCLVHNAHRIDPEADNWVQAGSDGPVAKIVFVSVIPYPLAVVCKISI